MRPGPKVDDSPPVLPLPVATAYINRRTIDSMHLVADHLCYVKRR